MQNQPKSQPVAGLYQMRFNQCCCGFFFSFVSLTKYCVQNSKEFFFIYLESKRFINFAGVDLSQTRSMGVKWVHFKLLFIVQMRGNINIIKGYVS